MAKKVLMQLSRADPKYLQKQREDPNRAKAMLVTTDHHGFHSYYPIPTIEDECRVFLMLLHQWYASQYCKVDRYIKEWSEYVKNVPVPVSDETIQKLPKSVRASVKEAVENERKAHVDNLANLEFFRQVKTALLNEDAVMARRLLLTRGSEDSEEFEIVYLDEVPKDYEVT